MSVVFSDCIGCKHIAKIKNSFICKAFPIEIPSETFNSVKDNGTICANGIGYEENSVYKKIDYLK